MPKTPSPEIMEQEEMEDGNDEDEEEDGGRRKKKRKTGGVGVMMNGTGGVGSGVGVTGTGGLGGVDGKGDYKYTSEISQMVRSAERYLDERRCVRSLALVTYSVSLT